MRLASSVLKYIPSLRDVDDVNLNNVYEVAATIGLSEYPNKEFTIAIMLCEITGMGARLWSDHLARCFRQNMELIMSAEKLAEFFTKYYQAAENLEKTMSVFGHRFSDFALE